jgi:hypothetical protein
LELDGEDDSSEEGDSSDDDLGLCPTYAEGAPLPSAGSAAHSVGACKRCCFFPKGRCNNGYDCQFCHFAHEKRKPKNKKKKKRKKKQRQINASSSTPTPKGQERSPHSSSPSVQHFLASSPAWQPQQPQERRSSQLIVHGLSFVPATVMPGNPVTYPMLQMPQHWF